MWKNPLDYRLEELKALRDAIESELEAFGQDGDMRKDDRESKIFSALLQIAVELNASSDKAIWEATGIDVSTVARWRKGGSAPPKRKQMIVLEILARGTKAAERALESRRRDVQHDIDVLGSHRGGTSRKTQRRSA